MASFVTRQDLEHLIGPTRVVELFDADRDGTLGDEEVQRLNETLSEADDYTAAQLLKKAWDLDQLDEASRDRALRRAACQIAAGLAGEGKPEFYDANGNAPFSELLKRGKEYLRDMGKAQNRSRTENRAGTVKQVRGRTSISTPSTIFGRDPNDPNDKYGDGKGF